MSDCTTTSTHCDRRALTPDQALTLFKMYEDKGWAVKQLMFAIYGLLTPVVFAVLAFCATNYFAAPTQITTTTVAAGWTAFALAVFMAVLIVLSLLHANRDYTRSHLVLVKARELLPQDIIDIMQDPHARLGHFGYIGWQFRVIMGSSVCLVVLALVVASVLSF